MSTIPPEIWQHVAKFIPFPVLRNMLTVNSAFFQLAMSARYYEAKFAAFDSRDSVGFLQRLRDPAVSRRVRCLCLDVGFSAEFNSEYEARYRRDSEHLDVTEGGWNMNIALDTLDHSFHEVIQTMTETVAYMSNIVHFNIYWRPISPSVEHLRPLLAACWKTIGSRLQKLHLLIPLDYMPTLFCTEVTGSLMQLRDFKVGCLAPSVMKYQDEPRSIRSTASLASFINKFAPYLRRLFLATHTLELDLSSLLHQLEHISHLERLYVATWYCESHLLENPVYVSRFLQRHAETLRCFRWGDTLPSEGYRSKDGRSKEELMVDWLRGSKMDEVFSNLLKLELPVPESDVGFSLLIPYIRRSASRLTYLKLWGCFLSYDKVNMLVSLFDPRPRGHPKELVLWVEALSPELVFLLARMCPCLETLNITISYVAKDNENGQRAPITAEEELANARKFAQRMREYDFHDWSLKNIHMEGKTARNDPLYARVMLLFGGCIPSLQTFNGSDRKPWCVREVPDDELKL